MALDPNSEATLKTIDIQQSVIARMAGASASAKNWCVTVVSAVVVLAVDKKNPSFAAIAIVPATLFLVMDVYYLALERRVRATHTAFAKQLREGVASTEALFDVGPTRLSLADTCAALQSKSIWPFYLLIGLSLLGVGLVQAGK